MTVVAVVAHPDDEVLGVGATLARHAAAGEAVHIVICATGLAARGGATSPQIAALENQARRAAAALGALPPRFLGLRDNAMDERPLLEVIQALQPHLDEISPTTVYTHHASDLNIDHGIVARAVLTACRPLPGSRIESICAFETPSSTEWATGAGFHPFQPNRFVDVAAQMPAKIRALECYADEMRAFPHPRSIDAIRSLAAWRGASAGLAAAEAFVVLREITR